MCSESVPKEFEKTTELMPLAGYGLSTVEDFRRAEDDRQNLDWLKRAGLTNEELKLYQDNEGGLLDHRTLIESSVLKSKLKIIYNKINHFQGEPGCSKQNNDLPEDSKPDNILNKLQKKPLTLYPDGHPMNELKELEESLFGHLRDDALPLSKRRKIMRRLERKRERIMAQENQISFEGNAVIAVNNPASLWDIEEVTGRSRREHPTARRSGGHRCRMMCPRKRNMYTIKENRIVRLEPVDREREEYRAVDIVMPVNQAEEELLEGTKMPLEDIMKIERFKDYEPGIPSKVLYLKNISPSVSQEQLSLLFNQFVLDNGGPIDVRLMTGRMRGQAFVAFQSENLAIQALDEVNGTILSGQPIIAQFGRNSNRIQIEENR